MTVNYLIRTRFQVGLQLPAMRADFMLSSGFLWCRW